MNFKRKLKTRLYLAISYIVLGVIMVAVSNIWGKGDDFLSSFGFALAVIGIVRIRNYFIITKNEESIRKQQIAETDERNIAISNKAKSAAFMIYIMAVCIAVIVLNLLEISLIATVLSLSVCAMVVVYWISYLIISRKY